MQAMYEQSAVMQSRLQPGALPDAYFRLESTTVLTPASLAL
jgi:hypothetical protein